jgi:hypothetical protein
LIWSVDRNIGEYEPMTGTPDAPREVLRLSIPMDLTFEVFCEAHRMITAREPNLYGHLTLICCSSMEPRMHGWDFSGFTIPYVVYVPDSMLKSTNHWALCGRKTEVVEDRNA